MTGAGWAYVSFVLIGMFVASWVGLVQRVQVGAGLLPARILAAVAMVAGLLALANSPGWLGGALAGVSLLVGTVFFFLGSLSRQSDHPPAVAVGQPLAAFEAPDHEGKLFRSETLRGRPMLIKFFRGHW